MVHFVYRVFYFGVQCGRNLIKLDKLYKSPPKLYFLLARENENFRAPGENRTRDPPNTRSYVLTTEPTVWIFVQNYAFLRRCCLRVWMAWGTLRIQENCILRALIFKFSWLSTSPLVKLVRITHVKSWIHPWKKGSNSTKQSSQCHAEWPKCV